MHAKAVAAEEMDHEWLELILEAKKIGISLEDIREFLVAASSGARAGL
ncbi:anti-repressor SinI family protein [Brevibacillus sp. GCM10020057]